MVGVKLGETRKATVVSFAHFVQGWLAADPDQAKS